MTRDHGDLPIAGIRVLDVSMAIQGPQACQMLADLGADVIKVELPGVGDVNRKLRISAEDPRSAFFFAVNRGKRSITLDLRTERGKSTLLRLVAGSDVIVTNFKPGTMEAWGIGYEQLREVNPRVVYATASAFGHLGPDASREGTDLSGQAAGGLISTTGTTSSDPTPVGTVVADHQGSQVLAIGILAALRAAERDRVGQRVDVSLLGGQIWAQTSEFTSYFLSGCVPGPANYGHPLVPGVYRMFRTGDGWVAICGVPRSLRPGFWRALERPDLADDPRFQVEYFTHEDREELYRELEKTFGDRSTKDWCERLEAEGQRFAPIRSYPEIAVDEQAFANGYLRRADHPEYGRMTVVGNPIVFSRTPLSPAIIAPGLGEHTEEILGEFGFSPDEIAELVESSAVERS